MAGRFGYRNRAAGVFLEPMETPATRATIGPYPGAHPPTPPKPRRRNSNLGPSVVGAFPGALDMPPEQHSARSRSGRSPNRLPMSDEWREKIITANITGNNRHRGDRLGNVNTPRKSNVADIRRNNDVNNRFPTRGRDDSVLPRRGLGPTNNSFNAFSDNKDHPISSLAKHPKRPDSQPTSDQGGQLIDGNLIRRYDTIKPNIQLNLDVDRMLEMVLDLRRSVDRESDARKVLELQLSDYKEQLQTEVNTRKVAEAHYSSLLNRVKELEVQGQMEARLQEFNTKYSRAGQEIEEGNHTRMVTEMKELVVQENKEQFDKLRSIDRDSKFLQTKMDSLQEKLDALTLAQQSAMYGPEQKQRAEDQAKMQVQIQSLEAALKNVVAAHVTMASKEADGEWIRQFLVDNADHQTRMIDQRFNEVSSSLKETIALQEMSESKLRKETLREVDDIRSELSNEADRRETALRRCQKSISDLNRSNAKMIDSLNKLTKQRVDDIRTMTTEALQSLHNSSEKLTGEMLTNGRRIEARAKTTRVNGLEDVLRAEIKQRLKAQEAQAKASLDFEGKFDAFKNEIKNQLTEHSISVNERLKHLDSFVGTLKRQLDANTEAKTELLNRVDKLEARTASLEGKLDEQRVELQEMERLRRAHEIRAAKDLQEQSVQMHMVMETRAVLDGMLNTIEEESMREERAADLVEFGKALGDMMGKETQALEDKLVTRLDVLETAESQDNKNIQDLILQLGDLKEEEEAKIHDAEQKLANLTNDLASAKTDIITDMRESQRKMMQELSDAAEDQMLIVEEAEKKFKSDLEESEKSLRTDLNDTRIALLSANNQTKSELIDNLQELAVALQTDMAKTNNESGARLGAIEREVNQQVGKMREDLEIGLSDQQEEMSNLKIDMEDKLANLTEEVKKSHEMEEKLLERNEEMRLKLAEEFAEIKQLEEVVKRVDEHQSRIDEIQENEIKAAEETAEQAKMLHDVMEVRAVLEGMCSAVEEEFNLVQRSEEMTTLGKAFSDDLKEQVGIINKHLTDQDNDMQNVIVQVNEASIKVETLKEEVAKANEESANQQNQIEAEIKKLRSDLGEVEAAVVEADTASATKAEMKESINEVDQKIQQLEERFDLKEQLEKDQEDGKDDAANEQEEGVNSKQVEELKDKLEVLGTKVKEVKEKSDSVQAEVDEIKTKMEESDKKLVQFKESNAEEVTNIKEDISKLRDDTKLLRTDLEDAESKFTNEDKVEAMINKRVDEVLVDGGDTTHAEAPTESDSKDNTNNDEGDNDEEVI